MKKMNSNITKVILIFGLVSIFMSCNEFLDEPKPTTSVTPQDVFSSEDGVRAHFNGIYRNLRSQWISVDGKSGGYTDTWGVVGINLSRMVKGTDIMVPYGWYQWDYRHENRNATYYKVRFIWDFLYENINQANIIIEGVEGSDFPESAKNKFVAEARALRAWSYFNLIQEYQHPYSADPNAPGIPVYTEPASIESIGKSRGTVQAVYDQIVGDLEYAVQNLDPGGERLLKSNININVAYGLLARVNLEMGQWGDAKNSAIAARNGYSLAADQYGDGFNQIDNPEWIWGFPQRNDQTVYYGNPASFLDHFILGYNNAFVNDDFVSLFSDTDVRNLFLAGFYGGASTDYYYYITTKFVQNEDFSDDVVMMRVAEMYLIEAEAKTELGESDAGDVLFALQSNRDPNTVKSGNTGQALIDEILVERRKELYGEIGVGFMDIRRRQLPLIRTGNHPEAYRFNIPANSDILILRIPQLEIDSNENISESDQNP
jgi:hypothetical protein